MTVSDPYRWLEDLDDPAVQEWVRRQNDVTVDYLEQIPERKHLRNRLRELWDYPKYDVPQREGGHLYISRNTGLQNPAVTYVRPVDGDVNSRDLFDPNPWSEDGTVSLSAVAPGPNGWGICSWLSPWRT